MLNIEGFNRKATMRHNQEIIFADTYTLRYTDPAGVLFAAKVIRYSSPGRTADHCQGYATMTAGSAIHEQELTAHTCRALLAAAGVNI